MINTVHIIYFNGEINTLILKGWLKNGVLGWMVGKQKTNFRRMIWRMHQKIKFVFKRHAKTQC